MIPIRLFFEINSKLSLVIGGFVNILLIWLVLKRTPKEMRIYSKILLQVCFSDLANLIVNDAVQPIVLVSKPYTIIVSCGPAGKLPYPWNAIAHFTWFFWSYFAMIGIVVQFAYRYMILCKGRQDSRFAYFLLVGTAVLLEIFLFGFLWIISYPPRGSHVEDPKILQFLGHSPDEVYPYNDAEIPSELRLTLLGDSGTISWIVWHLFFGGIPVIGYVFVVYSGRKMMKFVEVNLKKVADSAKRGTSKEELNRQMTLNLLIQACIPLLAMFCWATCAYVCIFGRFLNIDWFNVFSSLTATPIQCWLSVGNPLVTIITVLPYRRAILRMLSAPRVGMGTTLLGSHVFPSSHSSNKNNGGKTKMDITNTAVVTTSHEMGEEKKLNGNGNLFLVYDGNGENDGHQNCQRIGSLPIGNDGPE